MLVIMSPGLKTVYFIIGMLTLTVGVLIAVVISIDMYMTKKKDALEGNTDFDNVEKGQPPGKKQRVKKLPRVGATN